MDIVGINVGCGPDPTECSGWENVDKSLNARLRSIPGLRRVLGSVGLLPGADDKWPKNLRVADIRKGLPYSDDSLLYVYSSHCYEHLFSDQGIQLLQECLRVLKPGGVLRLVVPDLEILIRWYHEAQAAPTNGGGELPADAFMRQLLMTREKAPRGVVDRWFKPLMGKHTIHCWAYDAQSLMARLRQVGFTDVKKRTYLDSAIPDIKFLDLADKEKESLYVEGTKPGTARKQP